MLAASSQACAMIPSSVLAHSGRAPCLHAHPTCIWHVWIYVGALFSQRNNVNGDCSFVSQLPDLNCHTKLYELQHSSANDSGIVLALALTS